MPKDLFLGICCRTVNTNAPVMSALNAGDDVLMPDVGEIWIQGKVSGAGSTVAASVNGGDAIPLNRRDDDFGYLSGAVWAVGVWAVGVSP